MVSNKLCIDHISVLIANNSYQKLKSYCHFSMFQEIKVSVLYFCFESHRAASAKSCRTLLTLLLLTKSTV